MPTVTEHAVPNPRRRACGAGRGDVPAQQGAGAIQAFQSALAGYLAGNLGLEPLRGVVIGCVSEIAQLTRVIADSLTAAARAQCLPPDAYRVLLRDLANAAAGAPRRAERSGGQRDELPPGHLLGRRYLIRERVANGGIGVLYRALDLQPAAGHAIEPLVAIKMLSPAYRHCPDALRSLQREAGTVRQLCHANIRAVHAFERCGRDFYISMEWLDGESLAMRLDRTTSRPMAWPAARRILAAVGGGLTHAHERGIVHGDIKPGNVFITAEGMVKLLDFGQAGAIGAIRQHPVSARPAVSPAYASCELHEGARPEVRDDVFALAVMTYRILAGARPFGRYTPLNAERSGIKALRPAGITTGQWQGLERGLAWRREQRPAAVAEFLDALLSGATRDAATVSLVVAA